MKPIAQLDLFTALKIQRDRHYGLWQVAEGRQTWGHLKMEMGNTVQFVSVW